MALFCAAMTTGCKKDSDEPVVDRSITGDWHLESVNGVAVEELDVDIYMHLGSNGRFVLYQHMSTLGYEKLEGTYSATSTTLTGVYDDGVEWNGSYSYTLGNNGNTLTTVLHGGSSTETSVYTRTEIPADLPADLPAAAVGRGDAEGASRRAL